MGNGYAVYHEEVIDIFKTSLIVKTCVIVQRSRFFYSDHEEKKLGSQGKTTNLTIEKMLSCLRYRSLLPVVVNSC